MFTSQNTMYVWYIYAVLLHFTFKYTMFDTSLFYRVSTFQYTKYDTSDIAFLHFNIQRMIQTRQQ